MKKNLDEKATRTLLKEQKLGHLGCVLESGEPYVVPVNYLFKDDEIYIHCLPGQKLDALRANGKVCLQVEKIGDSCQWESGIAFGIFQEVKSTNKKAEILKEFSASFEHLTPVEAMMEEQWNIGGLVVFRLNVKRITGMSES
jgi:nitroimidazol reductase NimA-like FMN-containing flavoprotein (pyridoxamine 5'-phosphate oxidase superfamily)